VGVSTLGRLHGRNGVVRERTVSFWEKAGSFGWYALLSLCLLKNGAASPGVVPLYYEDQSSSDLTQHITNI
jgi:hypothetical protein